jgi:hypothetical protein
MLYDCGWQIARSFVWTSLPAAADRQQYCLGNFSVVAAEQNFFEGSDRFVRTLATHVSADDSGALLAAGQDVSVGSPATQLWKIQPNGTASYQSIVGQETQGSVHLRARLRCLGRVARAWHLLGRSTLDETKRHATRLASDVGGVSR